MQSSPHSPVSTSAHPDMSASTTLLSTDSNPLSTTPHPLSTTPHPLSTTPHPLSTGPLLLSTRTRLLSTRSNQSVWSSWHPSGTPVWLMSTSAHPDMPASTTLLSTGSHPLSTSTALFAGSHHQLSSSILVSTRDHALMSTSTPHMSTSTILSTGSPHMSTRTRAHMSAGAIRAMPLSTSTLDSTRCGNSNTRGTTSASHNLRSKECCRCMDGLWSADSTD